MGVIVESLFAYRNLLIMQARYDHNFMNLLRCQRNIFFVRLSYDKPKMIQWDNDAFTFVSSYSLWHRYFIVVKWLAYHLATKKNIYTWIEYSGDQMVSVDSRRISQRWSCFYQWNPDQIIVISSNWQKYRTLNRERIFVMFWQSLFFSEIVFIFLVLVHRETKGLNIILLWTEQRSYINLVLGSLNPERE